MPGRRKSRDLQKNLAARTKSKGKEIEIIGLEEGLEEFCLSRGDGYETVDEEAGGTPELEEEEDSYDAPGIRSDYEGGIRGVSIVGKRVEVCYIPVTWIPVNDVLLSCAV